MTIAGRPWIQTARGLAWCADTPEEYRYDISEIAHALSNLCRFAGHTQSFYSVAEHSVRVAIEARHDQFIRITAERGDIGVQPMDRHWLDELSRAALLHDAAEGFLLDMPAPIKRLPGLAGYRSLMKRTEFAITHHFGVAMYRTHPAIRHADLVLLATEKRDVMGPSPHSGEWLPLPEPLAERIEPWTPEDARERFVDAWRAYGGTP